MGGAFAAIKGFGLVGRDLIVPDDSQIPIRVERRVNLAQALHKVPREAVVVIDEQDHGG